MVAHFEPKTSDFGYNLPINGIDAAFGVYSQSADYQAMIGSGKLSVTLRNIMKVEPLELQNQSVEVPAFGLLTHWGSVDPMVEWMRDMTHLFEDNGAMFMRYWPHHLVDCNMADPLGKPPAEQATTIGHCLLPLCFPNENSRKSIHPGTKTPIR